MIVLLMSSLVFLAACLALAIVLLCKHPSFKQRLRQGRQPPRLVDELLIPSVPKPYRSAYRRALLYAVAPWIAGISIVWALYEYFRAYHLIFIAAKGWWSWLPLAVAGALSLCAGIIFARRACSDDWRASLSRGQRCWNLISSGFGASAMGFLLLYYPLSNAFDGVAHWVAARPETWAVLVEHA